MAFNKTAMIERAKTFENVINKPKLCSLESANQRGYQCFS